MNSRGVVLLRTAVAGLLGLLFPLRVLSHGAFLPMELLSQPTMMIAAALFGVARIIQALFCELQRRVRL